MSGDSKRVTEEQTPRVTDAMATAFAMGASMGDGKFTSDSPHLQAALDSSKARIMAGIRAALEASRVAPASQKEAAVCLTCNGTGHEAPKQICRDCDPAASPSPAPAVEPVGIKALDTCQTCQGNGEIVTDWDTYLHGDDDEHATAECPDCNGEGKISPTPVSAPAGEGWKIVPVEPTDEMLAVGIGGAAGVKRRIWQLMLSASPAVEGK